MTLATPRFGIGFRKPHYAEVVATRPREIDWFEVVSENFFPLGGQPRHYLAQLREAYPVACHGVGLSIASEADLNYRYLEKLKGLIDFVDPFLVTDHLCWTGNAGFNSFDLLPLPLTHRTLDHVSRRLEKVQRFLGREIALENPSMYVGYAHNDFEEADFLMRLHERTGCGVLLDLNNVFVNHINLGLDPQAYLARLAPGAVWQFHLAGHSMGPGGIRIDTHDHPLYPEVLALLREASAKFASVPVLLEWDDKIPPLEGMIDELGKIRDNWRGEGGRPAYTLQAVVEPKHQFDFAAEPIETAVSPVDGYQDRFVSLLLRPEGVAHDDLALELFKADGPKDRSIGIQVYNQAFYLRIRDCLRETFPATAFLCGEPGFDEIVAAFLQRHPPETESIDDLGERFVPYLESGARLDDDRAIFHEVALFEWTTNRLFVAPNSVGTCPTSALEGLNENDWERVCFHFIPALRAESFLYPVAALVAAAAVGEAPERPTPARGSYLFYRIDHVVRWRSLDDIEFAMVETLRRQPHFFAACEQAFAENDFGLDFAGFVQRALAFVVGCVGLGLVESVVARRVEEIAPPSVLAVTANP